MSLTASPAAPAARAGRTPRVLLWLPLPVALLLAPLLGGFWLGDDFSNLYRAWELDQSQRLLQGTLAFLVSPVDSVGSFYRPAMMFSISLLYLLFGDGYPGWAAASLLAHLANTLLVGLLAWRLLGWTDARTGTLPAPRSPWLAALCALAFGFCPLLLEGVAWVSARSDAAVTLLALWALWIWAGPPGSRGRYRAWALPLLMLPALGFKESAALFPLQLLMLMLVWPAPLGAARLLAVVASFGLVALFFAMRLWLFGSATEVYAGSRLDPALPASLLAWFQGLFGALSGLAGVWLAGALLLALLLMIPRSRAGWMGLALLAGAAMLVAATLLNLGGLQPSGEGGRLAYTPLAWGFLGLGLGLSGAALQAGLQRVVLGLLMTLVGLGGLLGQVQLREFRDVQDGIAQLAQRLPDHAEAHPGLTVLLVPDHVGHVVALRNGQGGLVMPPLQADPLLHRVLPTLPDEIELRHQQLAAGLATQLARVQPRTLEPQVFEALFQPAEPRAAEWIACWDARSRQLQVSTAPAVLDEAWAPELRMFARQCGLD